jgi:hypothetical protein
MSFAHDPSRSKERVLNDECYFPHFLPLTRPLRALISPQVTSRTALYLARRHPIEHVPSNCPRVDCQIEYDTLAGILRTHLDIPGSKRFAI